MAHSSSFKKGQVPVQCGLCKSENPIHFKCMECGDLLCSSCKMVHEKIKMTERHNIIEIKDVGNFIPKINLSNIPCQHHSGQNCCLFCNSCDRVVCPACVAKVHKSHDLIEIEKAYDGKKEILIRKGEAVNRKLEMSKVKQQKIVELKEQKTSKFLTTEQAIKENEKLIKTEAERLTNLLLQNLNQTNTDINKQFEKDEKALNNHQSKLETQIQDKNHLVTTTDGAEFFQKIDSMINSLDETPEPTTRPMYTTEFKFVPHGLTSIGEMQTEEVSAPLDHKRFGLSVINEFTTDLKCIGNMLQYEGDKLLISSANDKVLQNIAITGNTYKIISSKKSILVNAITACDEDILIANERLSKLQLYNTKTNKLSESPFDISPLRPNAIHVTESKQIIIGAFNAVYPKQGRRAVIIMDRTGWRLATFERDDKNQPIFALPISITSTAKGNIMVSDHDFENEIGGRVIVFDNKGQVIYRYTGHGDINQEMPFMPNDIVTTPEDTVIVADHHTHYLHVLDNQGRLLTLFNLKEIGIILPYSLAFSDSKHLYIGCRTYSDDEKRETKLFKVELS